MFPKSSSKYNIKFFLGLILIIPGLCLQIFSPRHSLYNDLADVFIFAGFALWQFGTYLFAPLLLFIASAILGLIPQISHQVSHTVTLVAIVLAVAIGLWGWWRERQTRAMQKKVRFEEKLD